MAAYCNETAHLFDHWDARQGVDVELHHRAAISFPALPDYELLGILIRRKAGPAVAKNLLARFGSLAGVFGASIAELESVAGADRKMAVELKALHEGTTRIQRSHFHKRTVISCWTALLAYAKVAMAGASVEQFRVLFLDKKNQLIADEVMAEGSVEHCPVYVRNVIKRALDLESSGIVMAHNHPSGNPNPSSADVDMTRQVADAARLLRIQVIDHIVVGRDGVASLKALGLF